MDIAKSEKIKKHKQNLFLLLDLLHNLEKEEESEEKILDFIKKQHESNEMFLRSLGVLKDTDKDRLRDLNEKIRELESENSKSITASNCCGFAVKLQNDIRDYFKSIGISLFADVNISDGLSIKLNHISQSELIPQREYEYYDSKEAINAENEILRQKIEKSKEIFTFNKTDNEYLVELNFENKNIIENSLEQLLSQYGSLINFQYETKMRRKKHFVINNISFYIVATASSQSLMRAFEDF